MLIVIYLEDKIVAIAATKEEAIQKASSNYPYAPMVGVYLDENGEEVGGFFVGPAPF